MADNKMSGPNRDNQTTEPIKVTAEECARMSDMTQTTDILIARLRDPEIKRRIIARAAKDERVASTWYAIEYGVLDSSWDGLVDAIEMELSNGQPA